MNYYIFYDPRNKDRIMGQSTDKGAMDFPYIKQGRKHNVLQHLEIANTNKKKDVKIKVGYWHDKGNILNK